MSEGGPLPVAVLGATGRMGRLVIAEVLDAPDLVLVAALASPGGVAVGADAGTLAGRAACGVNVTRPGPDAFADARIVIDFSLPDALAATLPHLGDRALVTGTTGLSPELTALRDAHAERGPLLAAANFSLGVHLLMDLVRRAASALPHADLEIVETHHRKKIDAPSGTALALADAAQAGRAEPLERRFGRSGRTGARASSEIGVHALRGGDVVGEHTVWFLDDGERVSLTHAASSRVTFARGAVRAARWIGHRPAGRYDMAQVLGLSNQIG
ncbi:MAG: 4-hydroxy-tetrahydrodipicolinate reductase [Myxococcales bacterium]|nr:4-hydroxy-tetrahydrodipicolinate reductase [Myxococcales bacterium]